jgi:hypothetical protein
MKLPGWTGSVSLSRPPCKVQILETLTGTVRATFPRPPEVGRSVPLSRSTHFRSTACRLTGTDSPSESLKLLAVAHHRMRHTTPRGYSTRGCAPGFAGFIAEALRSCRGATTAVPSESPWLRISGKGITKKRGALDPDEEEVPGRPVISMARESSEEGNGATCREKPGGGSSSLQGRLLNHEPMQVVVDVDL